MIFMPFKLSLIFCVLLCSLPLLWILGIILGWHSLFAEVFSAGLAEDSLHFLGHFAILFLLLSQASGFLRHLPLARLLFRHRRTLGLSAFFYCVLHLCLYATLEHGWRLETLVEDFFRLAFFVGYLAFFVLLALALTSTNRIRKYMGKNWQRLHLTTYLATPLVLVHIVLQNKSENIPEALLYLGVFGLILLGKYFFGGRLRVNHRI